MSNIVGDKQEQLEGLETIRFVSSTLFDVSAEKIARLRAAFERNSLFYRDISDLYESVKRTARDRGDLPKVAPTLPASAPEAGHAIYVAFTSNVRFYGSVNTNVMNVFLETLRKRPADAMVIGRTGKSYMESLESAPKLRYLSFAGDEPTSEEKQRFLEQIAPYDQIYVFHPSFVNVFTQQVGMVDITHTEPVEGTVEAHEQMDYIFEPELPRILRFFETRVRYLLFERVALESELARTAARLFAMNRAQDRADEEIRIVKRSIRKEIADFNDSRLLESFSAISKWGS